MGVNSDWNSEGSSQSEVGDLDGAAFVDEQILRLQISMENSALVTEEDALDDLVGVALHQPRVHHLAGWDWRVEVLLQVHRQELEDEVEPNCIKIIQFWLPMFGAKQKQMTLLYIDNFKIST